MRVSTRFCPTAYPRPAPFWGCMTAGCALSLCPFADDPLLFHLSREPLIEEFSIASQVRAWGKAECAERAETQFKEKRGG